MIQNWREKTIRERGRTENHIYLAPHALLKHQVAHYTIWTATEEALQEPDDLVIVPDAAGCIVAHWDNGPHAKLWGATTKAVHVSGAGVPVRVFIEFLPGGQFYFTGACQKELADGIFPLEEIAPAFCRALGQILERVDTLTELAEDLDVLLLSVMFTHTPPSGALSAANVLNRFHGMVRIEELSRQEGYSQRHLTRILTSFLGMGPKEYARLLRVNEVMRLMSSGLSLTHLAQEAGFYDQAHFIRDFKQICGVTPSFCRNSMSDFYKEPFKL